MPGKRESSKIKRDALILAAASHLFAQRGFENTRIEDVAELAEVSVGTIYLRYRNKTELLTGVLAGAEQKFVDAMKLPKIQVAGYPEKFRLIFESILATAVNDPEMPAIMRLAHHSHLGDWVPGESVRCAISKMIGSSQNDGDLRDDLAAPRIAAAVHGMVEGTMRHMFLTQEFDTKASVEILTDAARRWLVNTEAC